MPKEQPCLSERSPCPSSKNAKDKSNGTTLQASRGTEDTDDSSRRGSHCSSEKDSGYSDNGSDWQQTDVEDQRSSKSQPRGSGRGEAPQPGQGLGQGRAEQPPSPPGNRNLESGSNKLTPIYMIKNVVLKQPDMVQNSGQLLWRDGRGEASGSGATHVILLQQPSVAPGLPATSQLHKPQSWKTNSTGRKTSGTYLPILNSYPRIAPHPTKKPLDKTSSSEDSHNLSKRVCTEHKSDDASATSSLLEQHLHKQRKLAVLSSGLPNIQSSCSYSNSDSCSSSSPTTVSSSLGSPSVSSLDTSSSSPSPSSQYNSTSSFLATRQPHRITLSSIRHRRFLNTVEILSQSGLLDITLRTQELLRQSKATERDIVRLRQHTQLLCQAASNPNSGMDGNPAWEKLHQAMAESGGYPSLKNLQNEQIPSCPDSASQPESGPVGDTSGPVAAQNEGALLSLLRFPMPNPSQRRPTPQHSHSEQGREHRPSGKPSEKVTIMPPDSSTGWDVL